MKNSALEEISKKDTINFFVNVLKLIENTESLNPKVQQALFDAYTQHFKDAENTVLERETLPYIMEVLRSFYTEEQILAELQCNYTIKSIKIYKFKV
jgi:hypothetical protein